MNKIKYCAKCGVKLVPADNPDIQTSQYPYECMVCANL